MTITYDPHHPAYFDPADVRAERDRVFDLCQGCRLCWNLCPSFVSLFDLIDTNHDGNPLALTEPEHTRVVQECYQCKLCYLKCPYVPPHEWELDFPRLMMRSVGAETKQKGTGITQRVLASTDAAGAMGTLTAPIANATNRNPLFRMVLEKVAGIAKERLLPEYASERFSKWFRRRRSKVIPQPQKKVAVFGTCLVEYQQPAIGKALVATYEHNDIDVSLPEGQVCCGMPWLDAGNFEKFYELAEKNVPILKRAVDEGRDIVVPQPTCGYVLKQEYRDYVGTEDAKAVAAHTYDASEYLVNLRKTHGLKTEFPGTVPETITWHAPCHLRAQNIGFKSRDLMALTGTKVTVVDRCSGIDGTWGYREENYDLAKKVARPLADAVNKANSECVAGDCHLANTAIQEDTGRIAVHPLQVLARAYGLPEE